MKEQFRLIRVSQEALAEVLPDAKIDWGKPIEHVISDDNGKQYYEPVYAPTIYYNDNHELHELTLTTSV